MRVQDLIFNYGCRLKIAEEIELKLLEALEEEKNVALKVEKEVNDLKCQHQNHLQLLKAEQEKAVNQVMVERYLRFPFSRAVAISVLLI